MILLTRLAFRRQVTFLHVYHHSSITFVVGLIVPYSFSGDFYLPILLNSVVHVVMYSYYLLMVLKVPFPWKSMITIMQLVQFCLIMGQNILSAPFQAGARGAELMTTHQAGAPVSTAASPTLARSP